MIFKAKYDASLIDEEFYKRADDFWNYFYNNHLIIENKIDNKNRDFIKGFEDKLKNVLINYHKPLMFNFKKENNKYYFYFFYGTNNYLLTLIDTLFESKKKEMENWVFISSKKYKN